MELPTGGAGSTIPNPAAAAPYIAGWQCVRRRPSLKHRPALPGIDTGDPSMHTGLLPLDQPSTWLIALAFFAALALASRALKDLTGRAGRPAPGRERIAYITVSAVGTLGSVVLLEHLLHRGSGPVLIGMACGLWSLVAQSFFGQPMGR